MRRLAAVFAAKENNMLAEYRISYYKEGYGTRVFLQRGTESLSALTYGHRWNLKQFVEWLKYQVLEVSDGQTFAEWCDSKEYKRSHQLKKTYNRQVCLWKDLIRMSLM